MLAFPGGKCLRGSPANRRKKASARKRSLGGGFNVVKKLIFEGKYAVLGTGRRLGEGFHPPQGKGLFLYPPAFSSASTSRSHRAAEASLGIRQSPRGERATLPTRGPSGRQERLNCWAKKRR